MIADGIEVVLLEPAPSGDVTRFRNAMTLGSLGAAALREYRRRWHTRHDLLRRRRLGAAA